MNEIFTRTSIRKFTNQAVEDKTLEQLLRAAMQAPSATNQQPWEFYVVTRKSVLEELAKVTPYTGPLNSAAAAIVIFKRKDCRLPDYADIDSALASENLWLEAVNQGLGAVMLGIAPLRDRMDAVNNILNVEDNLDAFTIFAIGYPEEVGAQQDRFDASRIHYIKE